MIRWRRRGIERTRKMETMMAMGVGDIRAEAQLWKLDHDMVIEMVKCDELEVERFKREGPSVFLGYRPEILSS